MGEYGERIDICIVCKKLTRFSVCVRMSQFLSQINFVCPHYFCLSPLHFVPPTQFCPSPLHSVRPHYIMSVPTTSVRPHIPVLFCQSLSCVISGHGYPSPFRYGSICYAFLFFRVLNVANVPNVCECW